MENAPALLNTDRPVIFAGFAELYAEFLAQDYDDVLEQLIDPDFDPIYLDVAYADEAAL